MIDPAVIAAALHSAEAGLAIIEAKAHAHAGKPTEESAQIILETAHRITRNLREMLDTAERRTT